MYISNKAVFKRIFLASTFHKLHLLAIESNMTLSSYLEHVINELYDLKFDSKVSGQNAY